MHNPRSTKLPIEKFFTAQILNFVGVTTVQEYCKAFMHRSLCMWWALRYNLTQRLWMILSAYMKPARLTAANADAYITDFPWQLQPYVSPIWANIRSLVTCVATSPPLCSATAPMIAYNACARASSEPEPGRSDAYQEAKSAHSNPG